MYGTEPDQTEGSAVRESLGRLDEMAELKRPLSSTESCMQELEGEIMKLDETITSLIKRLSPVLNEKSMAANTSEDRAQRNAESPMAISIREKADRLRMIRSRVQTTIHSIDL